MEENKIDFRSPVSADEIRQARRQLRIGDMIEVEVPNYDLSDRRLFSVSVRKMPVIGIYPYLAEVQDRQTGRKYTVSYTEIALQNRRRVLG